VNFDCDKIYRERGDEVDVVINDVIMTHIMVYDVIMTHEMTTTSLAKWNDI
jgi:hypothetical protein